MKPKLSRSQGKEKRWSFMTTWLSKLLMKHNVWYSSSPNTLLSLLLAGYFFFLKKKALVSPLAKHWVPFWLFITQQQEKHMDFKWYQMISPHLREQQGLTAPRIWAKFFTVEKFPLQHANNLLNKFVHSVWCWASSKSARNGYFTEFLKATLPEIKRFIIYFKREVKSTHPAHFSIF